MVRVSFVWLGLVFLSVDRQDGSFFYWDSKGYFTLPYLCNLICDTSYLSLLQHFYLYMYVYVVLFVIQARIEEMNMVYLHYIPSAPVCHKFVFLLSFCPAAVLVESVTGTHALQIFISDKCHWGLFHWWLLPCVWLEVISEIMTHGCLTQCCPSLHRFLKQWILLLTVEMDRKWREYNILF